MNVSKLLSDIAIVVGADLADPPLPSLLRHLQGILDLQDPERTPDDLLNLASFFDTLAQQIQEDERSIDRAITDYARLMQLPDEYHGFGEPILEKVQIPAFRHILPEGFHQDTALGGRRYNFPPLVSNHLREWLEKHLEKPYPTENEKKMLAEDTKLSVDQINSWFINARRRLLPTMRGTKKRKRKRPQYEDEEEEKEGGEIEEEGSSEDKSRKKFSVMTRPAGKSKTRTRKKESDSDSEQTSKEPKEKRFHLKGKEKEKKPKGKGIIIIDEKDYFIPENRGRNIDVTPLNDSDELETQAKILVGMQDKRPTSTSPPTSSPKMHISHLNSPSPGVFPSPIHAPLQPKPNLPGPALLTFPSFVPPRPPYPPSPSPSKFLSPMTPIPHTTTFTPPLLPEGQRFQSRISGVARKLFNDAQILSDFGSLTESDSITPTPSITSLPSTFPTSSVPHPSTSIPPNKIPQAKNPSDPFKKQNS